MELVQQYYNYCHAVFWSETFWFTHNTTWKDFEDVQEGPFKNVSHPHVSSLYVVIPFAIGLCLIRKLLEMLVLNPLAGFFALKQVRTRKADSVPVLDQFFRVNRRPTFDEVVALAQQLSWPTRQVERWFRIKRNYRKSSVRRKFCEAGWRFTFYLTAFIFGIYVLRDEDFASDWQLTRAMDTWPHHHVKTEFWFYYMMEIGFYLSLFASLLTDVRRSDFLAMTIHHLLTIALLLFSWTINFLRIGLLILLLHDSSDYLLELAKMCLYLKKEKIGSSIVVLFASVWTLTRVYLYPVHLVYPSWKHYFEWYSNFGHVPSVLFQLIFLSLIVVLNMIWTYYIIMTIWSIVFKSDYRDERSGSELSDLSSGESVDLQNGHNGVIKNKHD